MPKKRIDAELQAKIDAVIAEHEEELANPIPAAVDEYPRFCFSRSTLDRSLGSPVRVICGLDDSPRGGTIIEQIGRAYRVDIGGTVLIVHEADAAWGF